jgi:hypothetical protein
MKKLNLNLFIALLAVALIASVTLFYACKKEEVIAKSLPPKNTSVDFSRIDFKKIGKTSSNSKSGSMLVFQSFEDYYEILDALQEICGEYTQNFIDSLIIANGGNDDENFINDLLDSLGFNPFAPFYDFSEILSFISLYLGLEEEEEMWKILSGNIEDNPFVVMGVGYYESLLYNSFGDVVVEGEVYQVGSGGVGGTESGAIGVDEPMETFNCNNAIDTKNSSTYTFKDRQRFVYGCLKTNKLNTHAYTRTYFKKKNGNWGNWFTKIRVQVEGDKSYMCDDLYDDQVYSWDPKYRHLGWGFYVEAWLYSPGGVNHLYRLPSGDRLVGTHWEDKSGNACSKIFTKL